MVDGRSARKAAARRAILDAAAGLLTQRRHLDFSMQEVADAAGVSLRSVYNHFPSRDDLLDATAEHTNQLLHERGGVLISEVDTLSGLVDAMARNYRLFDALDGLTDAAVQLGATNHAWRADHTARTQRFIDIVGDTVTGPTEDAAADRAVELVGYVVRLLLSLDSWHRLTRRYDLDTEEAITATRWAITTLVEQARAGNLPRPGEG